MRGILCTIISAVIFGFTPILARITYDGGSNGVTMTFLRAVLFLPPMFVILKVMKISVSLDRGELRDVFFACGLGAAVTTILLYVSYSYISVGMATTLHFVYPIVVSLGCVVFFGDRLTPATLFALASCFAGVILSAGKIGGGGLTGMILALLSGVTFAGYMIYADKTALKEMHFLKLSFWLCVMLALFSGAFGFFSGTLTFALTPKAWCYSFIVSFFTSMGAVTLLQLGIKLTGATTASILSTFEPITSVVLGIVVLGEEISLPKTIGCLCIIAGVVVITLSRTRKDACTAGA